MTGTGIAFGKSILMLPEDIGLHIRTKWRKNNKQQRRGMSKSCEVTTLAVYFM